MTQLPPRKRLMPVDRLAGVAPQFERTDGGWLFRRAGHGPAIRVTAAERDAFAAAGRRALLGHAAALVVCGGATWLVLRELLSGQNRNLVAAVIGAALSLLGLALYVSQRWYADAPARALAHRVPERPARDPDFSDRRTYGGIAAVAVLAIVMTAIGADLPRSFFIGFVTMVVMGALFVAGHKWLADAALSPAQHRRAAAVAATEQARRMERSRRDAARVKPWDAALLLGVLALEIVVLVASLVATVAVAGAITGTGYAEMAFGPFMVAFLAGLVLGGLLIWPLERWCKRRTGESAIDALNVLPFV